MKKQTFASIWDAIEETPEAAANMRLRADLMVAVQRHVAASGLIQAQAAKELGITQLRLNDVLRGRIGKFSLDTLIAMLVRAGKQVSVNVYDAA